MVVLTIGGPPGSGTTTVCRILEERLEARYVYAGDIFRKTAENKGLTLAQFGKMCEEDPIWDQALDGEMIQIAMDGDVILEGRMTGPMCKIEGVASFRVYIDADREVRAMRVMERDGGELEEVMESMRDREESEALRYKNIYAVDPRDSVWYDMVIDSSNLTPEEIADRVMRTALEVGDPI